MDINQRHWYQFKLDTKTAVETWLKNEQSSPTTPKAADTTLHYSVVPDFGKKHQYWCHLVNVAVTQILEKCGSLNWWSGATKLFAVNVKYDQSSLFNSIAICLWGVLDWNSFVSGSLKSSLMQHGNIWLTRLAMSSEFQEEVTDQKLLDQRITPYHLFMMANILHRPFIVVSDEEDKLKSASFHGIYLPVMSKPITCNKTPIFLAHCKNFFHPLSIEGTATEGHFKERYQIRFPVLKNGLVTLPLRFLEESQETRAGELLQDYLIMKESDSTTDGSLSTIAFLLAELKRLPEDKNTMLEFVKKFHHNPENLLVDKEFISTLDNNIAVHVGHNSEVSMSNSPPGSSDNSKVMRQKPQCAGSNQESQNDQSRSVKCNSRSGEARCQFAAPSKEDTIQQYPMTDKPCSSCQSNKSSVKTFPLCQKCFEAKNDSEKHTGRANTTKDESYLSEQGSENSGLLLQGRDSCSNFPLHRKTNTTGLSSSGHSPLPPVFGEQGVRNPESLAPESTSYSTMKRKYNGGTLLISLSGQGQRQVTFASSTEGNSSTPADSFGKGKQFDASTSSMNTDIMSKLNGILEKPNSSLMSVADQKNKFAQYSSKSLCCEQSSGEDLFLDSLGMKLSRSKSQDSGEKGMKSTIHYASNSPKLMETFCNPIQSTPVKSERMTVLSVCAGPMCDKPVYPPELLCERCMNILRVHSLTECDKSNSDGNASGYEAAADSNVRQAENQWSPLNRADTFVVPAGCNDRGDFHHQKESEPCIVMSNQMEAFGKNSPDVGMKSVGQMVFQEPKRCYVTATGNKDSHKTDQGVLVMPALHFEQSRQGGIEENTSVAIARSPVVTSMTQASNGEDEPFGSKDSFDAKLADMENSFSKQNIKCKNPQCYNYGNKDKDSFCNVCFSVKVASSNQLEPFLSSSEIFGLEIKKCRTALCSNYGNKTKDDFCNVCYSMMAYTFEQSVHGACCDDDDVDEYDGFVDDQTKNVIVEKKTRLYNSTEDFFN